MLWAEFASSCICKAVYNEESRTLTVTFTRNKQEYTHYDVPVEEFMRLKDAAENNESVGNIYNTYIRGNY